MRGPPIRGQHTLSRGGLVTEEGFRCDTASCLNPSPLAGLSVSAQRAQGFSQIPFGLYGLRRSVRPSQPVTE